MGDPLADALRSEIPCEASVATLLASLVRAHRARLGGGPEDTAEDLILRLRDPRAFGAFAQVVLDDDRVPPPTRLAVVEHVFDLLPLPQSEGELFDVEARAPPRLLALAADLAESGDLGVLQVMHLVYAVFLDRSLFRNVTKLVRSTLYRAILAQEDASEDLRALYACLHLAAIPEPEAAAEFRRTLRFKGLPSSLRRVLALAASSADGGRSLLASLAQREGLLPGDRLDAGAPVILANIPRLPERFAATGRRYLERRARG